MIRWEYAHAVGGAEINAALNTPPEDAYPEEMRRERERRETSKRGSLKVGLILLTPVVLLIGLSLITSVFRRTLTSENRMCQGALYLAGVVALFGLSAGLKDRTKYPSLEDIVRRFYNNVSTKGDHFKSYELLAPARMHDTSQESFKQAWESVIDDVVAAVATQDEVTCARCGKTSKGLWAVNQWWFKDDYMANANLFVACPKCESVYCNHCYVALPNRHECTKCGQKLKELAPGAFKSGLKTFMVDPQMRGSNQIGAVEINEVTDRVANITTEVHWAFSYTRIIPSDSAMASNLIALGDRGKVVCRFHNKAVKIGEEWRLLAATPATRQPVPDAAGQEGSPL